MTTFIEVPKGKNGVARAAMAHATERVFYAARLLRVLDSTDPKNQTAASQNITRRLVVRAMREAIEMAECAATIVESDIKK